MFLCIFAFVVIFCFLLFFFFNDTATTEIYTLSLHDALPISSCGLVRYALASRSFRYRPRCCAGDTGDRKSTRLNSSHQIISYAVFCLKKKKNAEYQHTKPQQPSIESDVTTRDVYMSRAAVHT